MKNQFSSGVTFLILIGHIHLTLRITRCMNPEKRINLTGAISSFSSLQENRDLSGEYFGENGIFFKHTVDLSEPLMRIPYIMRVPSLSEHKIISDPVQLVDVLPTVLSFLQIPIAPYSFAGRNLKALLTANKMPERKYIFSEFHPGREKSYYSVRDKDGKYVLIRSKGQDKVYFNNLLTIPGHMSSERKTSPSIDRYKNTLQLWMQETQQFQQLSPFQETEKMKENLRTLGYLD